MKGTTMQQGMFDGRERGEVGTPIDAMQYIEAVADEHAAMTLIRALALQEGFLGAKIMPASPVHPSPRVQAFFQWDAPAEPQHLMPDGCRLVLLFPSSFAEFVQLIPNESKGS